jgi:hypothetical protein
MLEILSGISRGLHGNDYDLLMVHADETDLEWTRRYLRTGRADGFTVGPRAAATRLLPGPAAPPRHPSRGR